MTMSSIAFSNFCPTGNAFFGWPAFTDEIQMYRAYAWLDDTGIIAMNLIAMVDGQYPNERVTGNKIISPSS